MRNQFIKIVVIAGLCLLAGAAYAGVSNHSADMLAEPPPDPKKKKAGEECKAATECQRHYSCTKTGQKSVCTAPEYHAPPSIPNTKASPPFKSDEPMVQVAEVAKEKRKKAGDECKTSSDCRRHYRCEKSGAWHICVPPEMKEIPKT
jgi:hypothetical protein